jgi:hypothetical protein
VAIDQTDIKDLNEKVLLEFEAYDRPHKVWTKEFYSSVIVIAFLVSIILYFIEGMMPVLVIWALVFMLWAMAKTEPKMVKVSFTSWGLRATEKIYRYEEMVNFWFETKWGSRLMRINLSGIPWHLVVVIDPQKEEEIKALIGKDVVYLEPETTWIDRVIKWVGEKMPLE